MRPTLRCVAAVAVALSSVTAAFASPSRHPFVAPGLWEVTSDIQGPMQQHSQMVQEQCWNAEGESGQAAPALPGQHGRTVAMTHSVDNTGKQSTVRLHSTAQMPQGAMTQDITMVFKANGSGLRRATMTGHGSMTFTGSPLLDETFTQHGHWLAATCPAELPLPNTTVLKQSQMPALTALQNLAHKLQAEDPHPNSQ